MCKGKAGTEINIKKYHVWSESWPFKLHQCNYSVNTMKKDKESIVVEDIIFFVDWLVGWSFGFYGISTFVDYLTSNPFLYK